MKKSIPQTIDICFNNEDGRECYSITAYEQTPGQFVASCDCEHHEQCGEMCDSYRDITTDEITSAHGIALETILAGIQYESDNGLRPDFEWEQYDG